MKICHKSRWCRKNCWLLGEFSLGLLWSPACLNEWIRMHAPDPFPGWFMHPITLGSEVMFIPKEKICLLIALKVVGPPSSINGPDLKCKPTASIESIWATSYHPCVIGGKGNWHKYDHTYTICCAMNSKSSVSDPWVLCLLLVPMIH